MKFDSVAYSAAHGGYGGVAAPLGGGAAVANLLEREWRRLGCFELEMVTPRLLGGAAPSAHELVRYDERRYARFCREFGAVSTEALLRRDPRRTAVLVNDVSEAPDFARLAAAGFRITTVYHVDVIAYIAAIYLRGRIGPARLAAWWEVAERLGLARMAPEILSLIFARQKASLEHSHAVVVPSSGMKRTLLECFPRTPEKRIHVLGWGAPPSGEAGDGAALRREYGVPESAAVLLTLSRISPEKGQDLLLEALVEWERGGVDAGPAPWLFICGETAYMQGERHMARLRALAGRLRKVKVVFAGYVSGARKRSFLEMADVYVFPSRHDSYGLTLAEALDAGLPALVVEGLGTRDIVRPEFGVMVGETGLRAGLERMMGRRRGWAAMGEAAREWARAHRFEATAEKLAGIVAG